MADWWEDLTDAEAHTVTTRLQMKQKGHAETIAQKVPASNQENLDPNKNADI